MRIKRKRLINIGVEIEAGTMIPAFTFKWTLIYADRPIDGSGT